MLVKGHNSLVGLALVAGVVISHNNIVMSLFCTANLPICCLYGLQADPAANAEHASSGSEQRPGDAAAEQGAEAVTVTAEAVEPIKQEVAAAEEKLVEGEVEAVDAQANGQAQSSAGTEEDGSGGEGEEEEEEDDEGGDGADLLLLLAEEAQREAFSGRRANGRPLRDSSNKRGGGRGARSGSVSAAPAVEAAAGPAGANATRKRPVRQASKGVMAWKLQQ